MVSRLIFWSTWFKFDQSSASSWFLLFFRNWITKLAAACQSWKT